MFLSPNTLTFYIRPPFQGFYKVFETHCPTKQHDSVIYLYTFLEGDNEPNKVNLFHSASSDLSWTLLSLKKKK